MQMSALGVGVCVWTSAGLVLKSSPPAVQCVYGCVRWASACEHVYGDDVRVCAFVQA